MTLKEIKLSSFISIHVTGKQVTCFKWESYEVKSKTPSAIEGYISYYLRCSCKDMVDCLSKVGHSAKRKKISIKQLDNSCYSNLKLDNEHICFKPQNNIMQKSQQGADSGSQKQNEMSPSSVEHNCVEKAEKPQNVWQRRDSFSSCSSDSAVYCSTRHTQINAPDEPVRILPCENSHVDVSCESKRQRHSSGSSVISIASDASCKEPQPGSGRKNILGCFGVTQRFSEVDATDISESVVSISHVKKAKPTLVNISKPKKEMVLEGGNTLSDSRKKTNQSPPQAVRLHDLRKNIRRKACCHGDCNETHTTFIVRRYTEVHHSNTAHQHSSVSAASVKRSAPSSSPSSSLDSSPNSNKKRKSEIDKLFAALHEIKWAKHFSPETILQQTEARRTSLTNKALNSNDSSSSSGLQSAPLSKGKVILKPRSPPKNCTEKNKVLLEKDIKSRETLNVRNRPSIHFLNAKDQAHKINNLLPPKTTRRGSWLSTKKKFSEKLSTKIKSSEDLVSNSVVPGSKSYTEMSDPEDDCKVVENDMKDEKSKHRHSPIFVQVASSVDNDRSTSKSQSHCNLENASRTISNIDSSPDSQSSSAEPNASDSRSDDLHANAQSAVICAKDSTSLAVPNGELQDCSLEHFEQDVNNSTAELVNDSVPFTPSSEMSTAPSNLSLCERGIDVLQEVETQDDLIEDHLCEESDISNAENHSCLNESLELPLLSSEDSPVKDVSFSESETPPVLEPCISLPPAAQRSARASPPPSHTPNHLFQDSAAGQESDSEKSCASSSDVLFVSPAKEEHGFMQDTEKDDSFVLESHKEEQMSMACESPPSSYSLKKVSSGNNRPESKTCDMSSSKRASRLILKKYVKNSNRKANNHKHKDSSWNDDDEKTWSCVVVDGDQDRDSDEENQVSELINRKIASPLTETVNNSGFGNSSYGSDVRTSTSKRNCEYQKHSGSSDSALSAHSNKSQGNLSSSSYVVHVKKVAHTFTEVKSSRYSSYDAAHRRHSKSGKALHLKEKGNFKRSKKTAVMGGTTSGTKNLHEERRELPQEVIKLRMLYGFTFHYKGITVNKNDSYTQVILKLTTSRSIFLTVEALMELKDTLNSAGNDSNCQVLIINGIGNSFCSGLDLRPLMGPRKKDAAREMAIAVKEFIEALASFHKPLVSVVNGSAVGLGVTLLTYSDVVLASDTASFHMPYAQLGYMPEGAVTLTLPHVMGSTVAMDMLLRGRKITAHQAHDYGLVSEVLEAKKLPQQLVSRVRILAESPVSAMESTKSMLRWHLYGKLHVALENEVQMLPKQWLSPACQVALKNAFQTGLLGE